MGQIFNKAFMPLFLVTWWLVTGVASGIIRDVVKPLLPEICDGFVAFVRVKDQEKHFPNFSKKPYIILNYFFAYQFLLS